MAAISLGSAVSQLVFDSSVAPCCVTEDYLAGKVQGVWFLDLSGLETLVAVVQLKILGG